MRNGYILEGFVTMRKRITMKMAHSKLEVWPRKVQRGFGTNKFGSSRNLKSSFVLLVGESGENTKLWVAEILLVLRMHLKG